MPEETSSPNQSATRSDNTYPQPSRNETSPTPQSNGGGHWGAWLVVGCLGTALAISVCVFIGGIAYLVSNWEGEAEADPTPAIAEEPVEVPEATAEPDQPDTGDAAQTPVTETASETIGPGAYVVGEEIEPGIYFANDAEEFCYWERVSDFTADTEDIIANQIVDNRAIAEIKASDGGWYASNACGEWQQNAPLVRDDPTEDFEAGTYLVADEVEPGTWQSEDTGDACYWARLSGFGSELEDVITNGFGEQKPIVEISPEDAGFESIECGTWVRIGD